MGGIDHALLIGIDAYRAHAAGGHSRYRDLSGAVRDVNAMASWLQPILSPARIRILVSTSDGSRTHDLPTYANIALAMKQILNAARPGEHLWLHYSGHGGRTRTMVPELKGIDGQDETLVPCDIDAPGGRYLHDVELVWFLNQAETRGLFVTLVLDCCHSGGAARNPGDSSPSPPSTAVARTNDEIDWREPIAERAFAEHGALSATWREREAQRLKGIAPQGFILLAACRDYQQAYEDHFESDGKNGALTWYLLSALRREDRGRGYIHLYRRLEAEIHDRFPCQSPRLEGEIDREFLGSGRVLVRMGLPLLNLTPDKAIIAGGRAHGVYRGMRLAVYDSGLEEPAQPSQYLRVEAEDGSYALCAREERVGFISKPIYPGDLVLPIDRGGIVLPVWLSFDESWPADLWQSFFARLQKATSDLELAWVTSPEESAIEMNFNRFGRLELTHRETMTPLVSRNPPHLLADDAVAQTKRCLNHLIWFTHAWTLRGSDPMGRLREGVRIGVIRPRPEERSAKPFNLMTWDPLTEIVMEPGQQFTVVIENRSSCVVHISLLCISQDGSVRRIVPAAGQPGDLDMDPNERIEWTMIAGLPEGASFGFDLFKLLVTMEPADASWLPLPPLGTESVPSLLRLGGENRRLERNCSLIPRGRPFCVLEKMVWTKTLEEKWHMKDQELKIVVIDKNPAYQQSYRNIIQESYKEAEVILTETVEHALSLIKQGRAKMVLTDYFPADATAMTLLREMGPEWIQEVPVVVVTNPGNQQMAKEVLEAGAIAYVERGDIQKVGATLGQAVFAMRRNTQQGAPPLLKPVTALKRLAESIAHQEQTPQKTISVGNWYALLIGINQYRDVNLLNLRAPQEDVKLMKEILDKDFVFSDVRVLPEEQATWEGIDEALLYYQQNSGADDSLLIFFAGHGTLETQTAEGYWFPCDAMANRPNTWYANQRLVALVAQMPMRHVLVIADCCFSGALLHHQREVSISDLIVNDNNLKDLYCRSSRWALTSTREKPVEDIGLGNNSPFVEALYEGLKGQEPFLTPEILAARIRENKNLKRLNQLPVCERIKHREENLGRFLFIRRSS